VVDGFRRRPGRQDDDGIEARRSLTRPQAGIDVTDRAYGNYPVRRPVRVYDAYINRADWPDPRIRVQGTWAGITTKLAGPVGREEA